MELQVHQMRAAPWLVALAIAASVFTHLLELARWEFMVATDAYTAAALTSVQVCDEHARST